MSVQTDAYLAVSKAVRKGVLKAKNDSICESCGRSNAIKHHDDYAKPLKVIYLCRRCHEKRHKEILKWGAAGRPLNLNNTPEFVTYPPIPLRKLKATMVMKDLTLRKVSELSGVGYSSASQVLKGRLIHPVYLEKIINVIEKAPEVK